MQHFAGAYTQAMISSQIIYNIRTQEDTSWWLFAAFVAISVLIILHMHKHSSIALIAVTKFRFMMMGVIYKKIHSLSLNQIDQFSKGKIINIVAQELLTVEPKLRMIA